MSSTKKTTILRHVVVASMWFGISFLWGSFLAIVLPFLLVPQHITAGNPALVSPDFKNSALAILEGFGLVFALVVQPAAGAFSDTLRTRWGRRRPLIVIGVLVGVLGLISMEFTFNFVLMIVLYCILQCGMNVAQGAYQGLLPDAIPPSERSRGSGFIGIFQLLGQAAGTVSAGFIDPRPMCAVVGAVLLVILAITAFGVHEEPLPRHVNDNPENLHRPPLSERILGYFADFRGHRDFLWVVLSRFSAYTGLAGIERFAANYLRDTYHGHFNLFGYTFTSDAEATSLVVLTVLILSLVTTYPAVSLSKRIGRRKVLIVGSVSGGIGSLLLITAGSLSQAVLDATFLGICTGCMFSVDWAYMVDLSPKEKAGKFLGFSNIATAGSQAAVPTIMGPIIDAVNKHTAAGGYIVLFAVSALFFFLGAAILSQVQHQAIGETDVAT
ncbi:MAG: MFS transporter [Candidatus Dormibacteria bacterium]